MLMVEDQLLAQEGLAVGRCLGLFYSDDGVVVSWDMEWLQVELNVLIGLFHRYGLVVNVAKYKTMTCHPGKLRSGMSEEVVGWWRTGRGETYCNRLKIRIPRPDYGVELTVGSTTAHRLRMYGTEPKIDWNRFPVIQTEQIPQVFNASFPKGTSHFLCPLPGCLGSSRI